MTTVLRTLCVICALFFAVEHCVADTLEVGFGWSVVPFIAYSPETRLQGGVAGFLRYRHSVDSTLRASSVGIGIQYTQNKQIGLGLYPELYFLDNGIRVEGAAEYYVFPYNFYGIGNNNPETNLERYTPQGFKVYANTLFAIQGKKVQDGFSAGFRSEIRYDHIQSIEPRADGSIGELGKGLVVGSNGGWFNGIGPILSYDTRDNNFAPYNGAFIELVSIVYGKYLGSSFSATNISLDARLYHEVLPDVVFALHGIARNVAGTPTFQQWSSIGGGNNLRGIYDAKQRSRIATALQTETRFPIWWRFRGCAFLDVGQVAEAPSQFTLPGTYVGWGGGIRFLLVPEERISLRFDVGTCRGEMQYYLNFNETF